MDVARNAMGLLEVDENGFDEVDRPAAPDDHRQIQRRPGRREQPGRPPSTKKDAIEDIYEPFLIQAGFLDRTPRGRVATPRAYEYFGLTAPGRDSRLW